MAKIPLLLVYLFTIFGWGIASGNNAYEFTTVLSPADRVVNGQDVELVCSYSLTIDPASIVVVNWVDEGGMTRGSIDENCDDIFGLVNTTQYGFSCLSIQNYTWTIKNVQETRNGTVWTCEIAIDSPNFASSDPTTIYVISPITNVSIDGNTNVNADAGSQTTVLCTTSTGRPVSTIRWYFDAGTPSDTSDDEEITSTLETVFDFGSETTSGSVTITAESNMNGWRIYATANNTESMTPIQSSNAVTLTVTASTSETTNQSPDHASTSETTTKSPDQASTSETTTQSPDQASTSETTTQSLDQASTSETTTQSPDQASTSETTIKSPDQASTSETTTQSLDQASTSETTNQSLDQASTSETTNQSPDQASTSETTNQSLDQASTSGTTTQSPDQASTSETTNQSPDQASTSETTIKSLEQASLSDCRDPPACGLFSRFNSSNGDNTNGRIASYVCDEGFEPKGNLNIICKSDGKWDEAPSCKIIECGQPSTNDTNSSLFWSSGTSYRDAAIFSCNEGYKTSDNITAVCQSDGSWTPTPKCVIKDCQNPRQVANGNITFSNRQYLSNATLTCNSGYVIQGHNESQVEIQCQASGYWSDEGLECSPIECGNLTGPANGKVDQKSGATYRTVATYTCDDGYYSNITKTKYTTTVCLANGAWSNNQPLCIIRDCGVPRTISNGLVEVTDNTTVDSTALLTCSSGYRAKTIDSGSANISLVCQHDGHWSGENIECQPIECPHPDDTKNGKVRVNTTTFSSTATYECNIGYKFNTTNSEYLSRICQANKTWSGVEPRCVVKDCGVPRTISNGQIEVTDNTTVDSTALVTCSSGYRAKTSESSIANISLVCQHDGHWSGENIECQPIECGNLTAPAHGQVEPEVPATYRTVAIYTCDEGYYSSTTQTKYTSRVCQENGTWSDNRPQCIIRDCHKPRRIANGNIDYINTTYMSNATFKCDDGYVIQSRTISSENIACQANGHWADEELECLPKDCGKLFHPINGNILFTSTTFTAKATYMCDKGYLINSNADKNITMECLAGGNWSLPKQTCRIQDCHPPRNLTDGNVVFNLTTYESIANYSCYPGYEFSDTNNTIVWIECLDNGNWSKRTSKCQPKDCGNLTNPDNGTVTASTTIYRSTADYTCNLGYVINGTNDTETSRTCSEFGEWSESEPVCAIRDCGPLNPPMNGTVNVNNTTYESVAYFNCNTGYEFATTNETTLSRECLANGTWSDEQPTCKLKDCGEPANITDGSVVTNNTLYESHADYTCITGYIINGTNNTIGVTRECLANGTWSEVEPSCVIRDCGDINDPENGSVAYSKTTYEAVANYSCDSGYEFPNKSYSFITRECLANGTWSGSQPTCNPKDCGNLTDPTNGQVNTTLTLYLSMALYTCNTGYVINGTNSTTTSRDCGTTGNWSESDPTCVLRDCGTLDTPNNSTMEQNGTTYLSVTNYTCDPGYEFAVLNETMVIWRNCLANGTWSGVQPSCQRKNCHALVNPAQGNVTFTSTLYEAVATYTCHAGYVFTDTNTSTPISRKCLENGTWSNEPPVCRPKDCGGLNNTVDGNVTTNNTTFESTALYTCEVGYTISGTNETQATRNCQDTGNWSVPIPTCSIRDCGQLSTPIYGLTNYNKTTYGATANYTCIPGYKFNSTNDSMISRQCSSNGTWTGFQPVCEIRECGPHTPLTHGHIVSENGTKYQDLISYSCENGYEVNTTQTSITVRCSESGSWEPNISECKDINECDRKAHNCHYWANCINKNGSYGCECRKGFIDAGSSSNPGRLCKDVDECKQPDACSTNGTKSCINAIGRYICICHQGYEGDKCEKDIDECKTIGCGVNALCTNSPGSYSCRCNETFPSGNPYIHCYENTLIKFEPQVQPRRGHHGRTPTDGVAFRYTYYGVQHHIFRAYQDGFMSLGFQPVFDHQAPPTPDKWRNSSWHNYGYDPVAILAPLWFYLDSVNTSNSGLYVHSFSADETGNVTDPDAAVAMNTSKKAFGPYINDSTFEPKVVIEATWVNLTVAFSGVTPLQSVERENVTMQVILVSNGISTYFMFNYAQEAWTIQPKGRRGGAVGYSNPDFSGNILANNVNFTRMTNYSTNSPLKGRHIFNVTEGTPAQMAFLQVEEDCRRYYYNTSARACLNEKRKHAYSCPCQQMFVQYEITLHEVTAQQALQHAESYPNKTACFQEWFSNYYGVKQTCCYEFGALAKDMPMGGLPQFDSDECGSLAAYETCCIKSHRHCHLYYEMNPPDDCTNYVLPVIG